MLLLSDPPGLRGQAAIEPGLEPGTTDLTVQVAPGDRVRASVELDNYGTREVGRERPGGTLRWASPTGHGDNLDLRAMVSSEGMWFGRLAYRSEEHTSELQSLMRISYAVFCLKNKHNQNTQQTLILQQQQV